MASVTATVACVANEDPEMGTWHRNVTALVGQRVKHFRTATVRELAVKCEQLGYRVEPQVIHNMEAGRRNNVSAAELLVLAAALEVPLALLLTPLGSDEPVELLPSKDADPWTAYRWLLGEVPANKLGKPPSFDVTWFLPPVVDAYRRHENGVRAYLRGQSKALAMIAGARVQMHEQSWWRPPLPEDVAEALRPVLLAFGWCEDDSGGLVRVKPGEPAGEDMTAWGYREDLGGLVVAPAEVLPTDTTAEERP